MSHFTVNETCRVLLVDDDPLDREMASRLLARDGIVLTEACDGTEALELLGEGIYDVIVSDQMMPNMNGMQLLRKAKVLQPEAVRILLTSKNSFELAQEAINRGEVFRYLVKPVDEASLMAAVTEGFERKLLQSEVKRLEAQIAHREEAMESLHFPGMR